MKRFTVLFALICLLMTCFMLPAQAAANRMVFTENEVTVFEGDTYALEVSRQGDPLDGEITYTSANEKVATVDENGIVTAVSKGQVNIIATVMVGKTKFQCKAVVTVIRRVASVAVDERELSVYHMGDAALADLMTETTDLPVMILRVKKNLTLSPIVKPDDAKNRKVVLSVSDESIVKVSDKTLQPKAAGTAILTVSSVQNPEVYVQYYLVVVQPVTGLKLTAVSRNVYVGDWTSVIPSFTPANATMQSVTWKSSNTNVATVDEHGNVCGIARGSATITATAADGSNVRESIQINVLQQPTGIEVTSGSMNIAVGNTQSIKYTISPRDVSDKSVVFESSDPYVAKVNANGNVTGVSTGSCTITVSCKDFPEIFDVIPVTVIQPVQRIASESASYAFHVGDSLQLTWEVVPSTATIKDVTFTSSNTKIATVDQYGLVTGHTRGTCYVEIRAADGSGKKLSVKIEVQQPVESVSMKYDVIRVASGETTYANAVIYPETANNKNMTWESADPQIASVSGNGTRVTIRGRSWGQTTIYGTTEDGGFTTSATVMVGAYDFAVILEGASLQNNKLKLSLTNGSDMVVSRIGMLAEMFDTEGNPLMCNKNGSNLFEIIYNYKIQPGDSTQHGQFTFVDYVQPSLTIGTVKVTLIGYRTADGYARTIQESRQQVKYAYQTYEK